MIFCAASFIDNKKYISNRKSYYGIRNASDRLCREYALSVVTPGKEQRKGMSYAEYQADREGGSYKGKLKAVIDALIPQSKDFEDFLKRLAAQGYEIKRGKHISVRAAGQERFTRTKSLGAEYAEDAITRRIAEEQPAVQGEPIKPHGEPPIIAKPHKRDVTKPANAAVNLIVDLENSVKAQQSAGLARWQKIQNLKEAAKTLNFLTENKLLRYSDLETKEREAAAAFDTAADTLKAAEKRLYDMAGAIKNITAYQRTKPVYDGMKAVKGKAAYAAYRKEHWRDIAAHETAAKVLQGLFPSGKLPGLAALQAEHAALTERKDALKAGYAALKKAAREYGVVRKNVDSILNPVEQPKAKKRERGAEL